MGRVVPRRFTRPETVSDLNDNLSSASKTPHETTGPPAPWTFRPEYPHGAPRVCRSNYAWSVMIPGRTGPVEVGVIDRMLHLYSHWGLTERSSLIEVEGGWHIIYDLDTEWEVVTQYGFWIEFVSDSQDLVARISRQDAQRFGRQLEHGSRPKWAVPIKHYSVHRRTT